jgi:hypothetical protein
MNILVTYQIMAFMAVIEQARLPALRVAFTIAVIVFLFGGYVIFRKRHRSSIAIQTSRTISL